LFRPHKTEAAAASDVNHEVNANLHFIAFVNVDGKLVELDGTKDGPVVHGVTTAATLLQDSVVVVKSVVRVLVCRYFTVSNCVFLL
jgi:ubiquitin carboxyl-terminal hydrolase L3